MHIFELFVFKYKPIQLVGLILMDSLRFLFNQNINNNEKKSMDTNDRVIILPVKGANG